MRSAYKQIQRCNSSAKRTLAHIAPILAGIAMLAVCWLWLNPTASRAASRRCLHHSDCPTDYQCLQRRCFKGLTGTVGGRNTSAYKLAIAKVRWFGAPSPHAAKLQRDIWLQVHSNFKTLPGSFNVLNPASFLERPPYNGVDLGTFYFKPWHSIKTNGLIKIGVRTHTKGQFTLMFRYYDVDESKMVFRANQTISTDQYRWAVHKLCDRVYKYLTNQSGIFSTLIAYVKRNRKGGKDIWVSDYDGGNPRCVIRNGRINVLPRWSPDGQSLLFTSYITGGAYLYRLQLATRRVTRITKRQGTFTGGTLSPNGTQLAFSMTPRGTDAASDIYIANSDGTEIKKLTTAWGIDVTPSWSPDGKRMAFVSERFASPQIFFMNADGSAQTRLTFKGNYNQEPRWSPRGDEILFTARDEFLQYDLFVIRLDKDASGQITPSYRRLTQNQGTNLEATWSPDGRYILFVSTRVGERKLYIMNTDGSKQRLFIRGWGNYATPDWSPLMKQPTVPVERNYYAKVVYVGYKKDALGDYIPTKEPLPARAKAAPAPTRAKLPAQPASAAKPTRKTPPTARTTVRKAPPTGRAKTPPTDKTKPDERKPDERKPVERKPDARKPDARKPDKRKPAQRKPDERKPTEATPDESKTDNTQEKTPAKRSQPTKRREG